MLERITALARLLHEIRPCSNGEIADRSTGLGASEIGAVLGLSEYAQPYDVWAEKVGLHVRDIENEYTRWGLLLETPIADRYLEDEKKICPSAGFVHGVKTIQRPELPYLWATPDRICCALRSDADNSLRDPVSVARDGDFSPAPVGGLGSDDDLVFWGLECKNVSWRQAHKWGESGTDEIPENYMAQIYQSLLVTGLDRWDVACLIGGNDFRVYRFWKDLDWYRIITTAAQKFWKQVEDEIPPDVLPDHPLSEDLLRKIYQDTDGGIIELTEEDAALVTSMKELGKEAGDMVKAETTIRNMLRKRMKNAAIGRLPNGLEIVRRETTRKGYTVEPSTTVTMTIRKQRGGQ